MGLTGTLLQISTRQCPHCRKDYGKHSKKQFMRCLYTANHNLYSAAIRINELTGNMVEEEKPKEIPQNIVVTEDGSVEVDGG